MSVNNAILFIRRIAVDKEFRKEYYGCSKKADLHRYLATIGMDFLPAEFPIAFDMVHLRCQTIEEADLVKQVEIIYHVFPQD